MVALFKIRANTPINLYFKNANYIAGEGNSTTWEKVESSGFETYYCEWNSSFGDRAFSAEAIGIKDSATIKTFYNPEIYRRLKSVQVLVIKNADISAIINGIPDKNNSNVYEVWGGVENVNEENRYLEFKVRRYEGL